MKALFIINPNAGLRNRQIRTHGLAKRLFKKRKLEKCEIVYTQKGGDAFAITSGLAPGEWDFVLAAGGDGTMNEVVSGLVTSDCGIPLLMLGAGTTNDFVTALGIGGSVSRLEKLVNDFCVRDVDIGICNGNYFLNVASGGIIPSIAHSIPADEKAHFGILAYYFAGLGKLVKGNFKTTKLYFTTRDETFEEDVFMLVISNSRRTGGFGRVSPKAKLDDGKFDVCIMRGIKRKDMIPLYLKIRTGRHIYDKRLIRYFQTDMIKVEQREGVDSFNLDYDGENAGGMPLDISLADRKLKLIVPGKSSKTKKLFGSGAR